MSWQNLLSVAISPPYMDAWGKNHEVGLPIEYPRSQRWCLNRKR